MNDEEYPVWINRFGIRTPLMFLKDIHILNNLRFLKRKGMKNAKEKGCPEAWEDNVPPIYWRVLDEAQFRGLDYQQMLEQTYETIPSHK